MKREEHGVPIIGNMAAAIKNRAEGVEALVGLVKSIPIDDLEEWIIVLSKNAQGMATVTNQIPQIGYALIKTVGQVASEIKDPQVAASFMRAVNTGLAELDDPMNDLHNRFSEEGEQAPASEIAASFLRFLQKMENEDENSTSGVSDSGSRGGSAPIAERITLLDRANRIYARFRYSKKD